MPNRFSPGCCGCQTVPPTCLIFEDDFDPDTITDDWSVISGSWSIDFTGRLRTESNNAVIIAQTGGPEARHWEGTIESSEEGSTCGVIVACLDGSTYIYVKILFPVGETAPDALDGTPGSITVIEVVDGVETAAQPATIGPQPGLAVGSVHMDICVIEGKNGNLPVVQVSSDYFPYVHACISAIHGSGCGYRTDALLGGAFDAVGIGMALSHNYRSDSELAQDLVDPLSCECICQCQIITDTASPSEVTVALSDWGPGFDATCGSAYECGDINGDYVLACNKELSDTGPCTWTGGVTLGSGDIIFLTFLLRGPDPITGQYSVQLDLKYGIPAVFTCGQMPSDIIDIGTAQPTMDGFSHTFTADDFDNANRACTGLFGSAVVVVQTDVGCP